jgi:large subunit ribosomal protein L25
MAEAIAVQVRDSRGKRNARRLRAAGQIPAVLYGHGEGTVALSVPTDQVSAIVRHGTRVVDLTGGVTQQALIRDLQWDVYGTHLLHLDLARISAEDVIQMHVPVELRGAAPGVKDGGVIEHLRHELEIECRASQIPEKLQINVNELQIGQEITVAGISLPEGVRVLDDPEAIVVQCVQPKDELEGEAPELGAAEPELIGRKPTDEEEGGEE